MNQLKRKERMKKALLSLTALLFVLGTYYGAWTHNAILIVICFMPQVGMIGYKIAKD